MISFIIPYLIHSILVFKTKKKIICSLSTARPSFSLHGSSYVLCIYSCNILDFHMEIVNLNKHDQIHVQIRMKLNRIPFHSQFELLPFPFPFLSSTKPHWFNLGRNLEWRINWSKYTHTYNTMVWRKFSHSLSIKFRPSLAAHTSEIYCCNSINNVANLQVIASYYINRRELEQFFLYGVYY